ncbi:hypothetical protein LIER_35691 [Lithospermum erythrorhizon]|uniref:Uncharacterized protein n=1 Tax=Lithospermum erythrorhizon TaxID=34254 RepID=A0AAV3NUW3_LITER
MHAIRSIMSLIKNVDDDVKERLWTAFKNYFDLDLEESTVRHLFYKQSSKWYREAMHTTKKEALRDAKLDDMMDLVGKVKPASMHTQATLNSFIQHWTDMKTMLVSQSAKKSPSTEGAGRHGLGNVSLKNRMRKHKKQEFVPLLSKSFLRKIERRTKRWGWTKAFC